MDLDKVYKEIDDLDNKLDLLEERLDAFQKGLPDHENVWLNELISINNEIYDTRARLNYLIRYVEKHTNQSIGYEYTTDEAASKHVDYSDNSYRKPVKRINKTNEHKTSIKINERSIGKLVLPVVAALLIILAAATFVGTFWQFIPDIFKSVLLMCVGLVTYFTGVKLYDKKGMYPFIVIAAIGSSVSYIGIVSANIVYNTISVYMTFLLVIIWAAINMGTYLAYKNLTLLGVIEIGLFVSTLLIGENISDAGTTEMFINTIVAILISVLPVVISYVPKIKENITWVYNAITRGSAILNLGIYLGYVEEYFRFEDYELYPHSGLVIMSALAVAIIITTIAMDSKITNSNIPKPFNYILNLVEIQFSMGMILMAFNGYQGGSIISPIVYLGCALMYVIRGYKIPRNYCYVAFNIWLGMYGVIGYIADIFELNNILECGIMLAVISMIYIGVYFGIGNTKSNHLESKITMILVMITMFVYAESFYKITDSTDGTFTFIILVVAFFVTMYHALNSNYTESNAVIWDSKTFNVICRLVIDIIAMIIIASAFGDYTALLLVALYNILTKITIMYKPSTAYRYINLGFSMLCTAFLVGAGYGVEESTEMLMYTTASICFILIFAFAAFDENNHDVAKVIGTIFTLIPAYNLCSVYTDSDSIIGVLVVLIASAVMLTIGFMRRHKSVRITSLVTLLISVANLINRIIDTTSTMSTVLVLLVSGIVILAISIMYNKLEKKLLVEVNNGGILDEPEY